MVRVVAFRKAVIAGSAGAIAMEAVLRLLASAGWRSVDLAAEIGSLAATSPLTAVSLGLIAHVAIGVAWAVFYGYFFWARTKWWPPLQGLAFAALPALLAVTIVYPQLTLMQLPQTEVHIGVGTLLAPLTPAAVLSLVAAHAAYGLTIGALYTRPVGYPVDHRPAAPRPRRRGSSANTGREQSSRFMFATGIECSYPTIERGGWRRDEMASTRHYQLWQRDFELARELGVTHIRYGPPLHLILRGHRQFEWDYSDPQMEELREFGPEPIVDLCHFGVPAWLGDFQNPDIASALGDYAATFAERYPWVRFYTPVNEMYVCARMSALQGIWNEQRSDEAAFVTAALNLARASIAMSDAILARRPDAIFINSESSEFYQPCCPDQEIEEIAAFENERRFLPLDLIYAHPVSERMQGHLYQHGVTHSDLGWFAARQVPRRSILGLDYYEWNERLVDRDGKPRALGELFGWYVIADQYYRRYGLPMMHTETNRMDANDAPRWLWRQWHNVQLLRQSGAPLVGFTWYSLVDQIDWSIAMGEALGLVYPVGLFDLNREARAVGLSYKHLIELYRDDPEYLECAALNELMR